MARSAAFEPVYQAFASFRGRCLLGDRSLLWPGREVWTIANLELVRRRFVEGFIQGQMSFREKLEAQLSGAPAEAWALVADCFYLYGLPSSTILFPTKKGWVEWAASKAGLPLPPETDALWAPLKLGFAATGQKYNLKHAQLRLLVLLALEVKGSGSPAERLGSPQAFQKTLDKILNGIPLKLDRANDMRNALLYMAFPDEYEPVLSNRDKDAILQHYGGQVGGTLSNERDEALRQVRQKLRARFEGEKPVGQAQGSTQGAPQRAPFDFFRDLREEWRDDSAALGRALAQQAPPGRRSAEPAASERRPDKLIIPDAGSPAERENLDTNGGGPRQVREPAEAWESAPDVDLQRVLAALHLSRNVILSGPPGTGKTYIAHRIAERLIEARSSALARWYTPDHYIAWVSLHPSYTYEDFVEGLRPVLAGKAETNGALAYEIRPGVFREISDRAANDPDNTYVLVLDEINRGSLARVLGELITLIDDDKRGVLWARLPASGTRLSVPPNLVLLGTMNTADRSVALLDSALRRRFAFVEFAPRPDLLAGVVVETEEAVLRLDALLRDLNAALVEALDAEHAVGHSYLLRVARAEPEERLALLEQVWNTQILPLLEEYFYNQRERLAEILAPFIDDSAGEREPSRTIPRLVGEDLVVALSRLCGEG